MTPATSDGRLPKVPVSQRLQGEMDPAALHDAVVKAAVALLTPEQIAEVVANRVIVEQAKGMLMFIYDVDPDRAFALLLEQSETANVKLRELAAQLTSDLRALGHSGLLPPYDEVLHTAHHRILRDR